jgi:hypothetical protein
MDIVSEIIFRYKFIRNSESAGAMEYFAELSAREVALDMMQEALETDLVATIFYSGREM